MTQQIETRSEKLVICDACRGTGLRTVLHPEPANRQQKFEWSLQHMALGAIIPTKQITCDRCAGQRLLKRIKATTYERLPAPEPTPDAIPPNTRPMLTWAGGELPVASGKYVEVELRSGNRLSGPAGRFTWTHGDTPTPHDIVAWRVA